MARTEFVKDDYFKIDVECHLSGDIKKYIEYFPGYKMWWQGTGMTAAAFGAVPKKTAGEVPKAHAAAPKAEGPEVPERDKLIGYMDRFGVDMACLLP